VISIVVLTHNRVDLLRRCVENVLLRTSERTKQIVIWNNASTDATRDYLDGLDDERLAVVHHPENLAMNGLCPAFELAAHPFVIELDDDIVDAPNRWDEQLLEAYERLPEIGLLCAAIADNPHDPRSRYIRFLRDEVGAYEPMEVNGVRILRGSVGGACTIVSRELYDRVGGFTQNRKYAYWRPEIPFQRKLRALGYESAFLVDLDVVHDSGHSAETPAPKAAYYWHETRLRRRKDVVKRLILAIPFASGLNRRFDLFDPPLPPYDPLR
jgi:GT2 family glycosyltransferase